ncbi:polysaccharide deacetylase family protein [Lentibacillus saliphilus]|uniref:polysaccharide deacetylase family protein n=1 Tax=Lentibacillus saliphilus TaxID=2737028 RepID=UPI001C2FC95F|nr:polysaccharide deacetylase family protein [Lentibacillus saliphilus]
MKWLLRYIVKLVFMVPIGVVYQWIFNRGHQPVILMYHRVHDAVEKELAIKVDHFKWQMAYLQGHGYHVISMDELVERIKTNRTAEKYIVLTFDDGYNDYAEEAVPILKTYHYPSLNYFVPGFIDTDRRYWWDEDLDGAQTMTWSQIDALNKNPLVTFGAHTMTHPDLDKLPGEAIQHELRQSQHVLEAQLHKPVSHFSYPRGRMSPEAVEHVHQLFQTGVLIFSGIPIPQVHAKQDLARLKRVPIQRSDGKLLFVARIKGWLIVEEWLRKVFKVI